MRLSEVEREEVALAREEKVSLPAVKWMVVAKLLMLKQLSEQSLILNMRAAWNATREVSFYPIGKKCIQNQYLLFRRLEAYHGRRTMAILWLCVDA